MASNLDSRFKKPFRYQCTQCGNCCKDPGTIVNLTFTDIKRFHTILKYNIPELLASVGFYIFEISPTKQQLKQMVVPPIQTQKGPAFLGLRKDESGKCIFLSPQNKCNIYSARPSICRTFPFHFHSTPHKTPKPNLAIEMTFTEKAKEYCPGIGAPSPIINDKKWMNAGKKAITDLLQEVILIQKWNKAVKEGTLSPVAENYLTLILNLGKKISDKPPKGKRSYQSAVREKINK